tara:strand:- start:2795 stop:3100 length:306 start_codon:yes stop_codon:yes gene_type:complete
MAFAAGKKAYGLCDICGQRYRLLTLKKQWDGLKVCAQDYSEKHPQLQPKHHPADPQALREPRPDTDVEVDNGRVFTNLDNIGSMIIGNQLTASIGTVTITS